MDWDNYHIFLELMRAGSLSGAAKAVGMTHPTIRRRLEDMERILGVVLFTRSPDGMKPTAAAAKLRPAALLMESAVDQLMRSASTQTGSVTGAVKIVCGEIMALEILPRVFAILRALQPGLRLEVSIDNNPVLAIRGAADISVQRTRPTQPGVFTTLACKLAVGLFAHRTYVEQAGAPASVEDLKSFSLIGSNTDMLGFGPGRAQELELDATHFAVRSDSFSAQMAAIRAGAGIGAVHVSLASRDPDLVRVLPIIAYERELWLAMREDVRGGRLRIAFDLIADHLAAYARESSRTAPAFPDTPRP